MSDGEESKINPSSLFTNSNFASLKVASESSNQPTFTPMQEAGRHRQVGDEGSVGSRDRSSDPLAAAVKAPPQTKLPSEPPPDSLPQARRVHTEHAELSDALRGVILNVAQH